MNNISSLTDTIRSHFHETAVPNLKNQKHMFTKNSHQAEGNFERNVQSQLGPISMAIHLPQALPDVKTAVTVPCDAGDAHLGIGGEDNHLHTAIDLNHAAN